MKHTVWSAPGRIDQLDSLRGLAALAVVFAHFHPEPLVPSEGSPVSGFLGLLHLFPIGNLGVVFFFSLSAFLLTRLARTEFISTGSFSLRYFYIRRCLRIWPLYFAFLAVIYCIYGRGPDAPRTFILDPATWSWLKQHAWLYLTYSSNWSLAFVNISGHFDPSPNVLRIVWSIAVEEQFYLFHPLLVLLALSLPRARLWCVVGLLIAGWAFRLWFITLPVSPAMQPQSWGGMYYATFSYLDVFLAGGIAGWMSVGSNDRAKSLAQLPGLGSGLLAGCLLCGWMWNAHLWHPYSFLSVVFYPLAGGLFGMVLLWFTWNPNRLISRLLRLRPLRTLGFLSYGIYIWHVVSNNLLAMVVYPCLGRASLSADMQIDIRLMLSVGTAIGMASISYFLVERPFLLLKNRFLSPGISAK